MARGSKHALPSFLSIPSIAQKASVFSFACACLRLISPRVVRPHPAEPDPHPRRDRSAIQKTVELG